MSFKNFSASQAASSNDKLDDKMKADPGRRAGGTARQETRRSRACAEVVGSKTEGAIPLRPSPTAGVVANRASPMTVRTTRTTVTFANPFTLGAFDELLPPGTYDVEIDEELMEGLSFHAYRRTLTLLHLPAKSGLSRTLTIDPNELDAALKREARASSDLASVHKPF